MEELKFDGRGLVCAIAQDYESGEVLKIGRAHV